MIIVGAERDAAFFLIKLKDGNSIYDNVRKVRIRGSQKLQIRGTKTAANYKYLGDIVTEESNSKVDT